MTALDCHVIVIETLQVESKLTERGTPGPRHGLSQFFLYSWAPLCVNYFTQWKD